MEVFSYVDYKHPLEHSWTLWYLDGNKTKSWTECLMEVGSFGTVEDFWCLFNHIKPVSHLKSGCDYSLFKKGIRPMWEDEANKNGGRWIVNVDKKTSQHHLDHFWLELVLNMIGETFQNQNEKINGVTINIRSKGNKIGVWTRDYDNSQHEIIGIGMKLKELFGYPPNEIISYQVHNDALTSNTNGTKYKYYV